MHLQMHNTYTHKPNKHTRQIPFDTNPFSDRPEETRYLTVSAMSKTHELGRMLAWTKMGRWTPNNFAVRCVKIAMCHGFMTV